MFFLKNYGGTLFLRVLEAERKNSRAPISSAKSHNFIFELRKASQHSKSSKHLFIIATGCSGNREEYILRETLIIQLP